MKSLSDWTEADERRLYGLVWERKRRAIADSLGAYCQYTIPEYKDGKHLREIDAHLEAVEQGRIKRLIIVEPPRFGKSMKTSQRFPAWYFGRNPGSQVLHTSYGGSLVTTFGGVLRNLMQSPMHQDIFPGGGLQQDSKAKNLFHTEGGGTYVSAGVGGGITGRGFHLGIIDDPVKGHEDADSEHMREKTWEWYMTDFRTRRMPGAAIVVISTRWHDDDLVGRLLKAQEKDGDQWVVLHHPALDKDDHSLWPEMWPDEEMIQTRKVTPSRTWQCLYQGNPTPEEGIYFEKEWIHHEKPPSWDHMRYYGASDYAVTDDGGDYTVHMVIGIDPQNRIWVVDLWRKQTKTKAWIDPMLDRMDKWQTLCWAEEKGQIEKSVGPFLLDRQLERKILGRRMPFTSATDKAVRARSIQGKINMDGLWIPENAHWGATLEKEMLQFPRAKNDDQVDCLSLIGRMLAGLEEGVIPPLPEEVPDLAKPNPYGVTFSDLAGDPTIARRR